MDLYLDENGIADWFYPHFKFDIKFRRKTAAPANGHNPHTYLWIDHEWDCVFHLKLDKL